MSPIHDPLIPHPQALLIPVIFMFFYSMTQIPAHVWTIIGIFVLVLCTLLLILSAIFKKDPPERKSN